MGAKAIGLVERGKDRKVSTPFNKRSEICRTCGACIYICPACQLRCDGPNASSVLCNKCLDLSKLDSIGTLVEQDYENENNNF